MFISSLFFAMFSVESQTIYVSPGSHVDIFTIHQVSCFVRAAEGRGEAYGYTAAGDIADQIWQDMRAQPAHDSSTNGNESGKDLMAQVFTEVGTLYNMDGYRRYILS